MHTERLRYTSAVEEKLSFEINESFSITTKCWHYAMLAMCYTGVSLTLHAELRQPSTSHKADAYIHLLTDAVSVLMV